MAGDSIQDKVPVLSDLATPRLDAVRNELSNSAGKKEAAKAEPVQGTLNIPDAYRANNASALGLDEKVTRLPGGLTSIGYKQNGQNVTEYFGADQKELYSVSVNPKTGAVEADFPNGNVARAYDGGGRRTTEDLAPDKTSGELQTEMRTSIDIDGDIFSRTHNPNVIGSIADKSEQSLLKGAGPGLCKSVTPASDASKAGTYGDDGHAILKTTNKKFPNEYLLLPTAPVTGIEDPHLIAKDSPNYIAQAWNEAVTDSLETFPSSVVPRDSKGQVERQDVPRDSIALAVNSMDWRSQDRLHIHADTIDPDLAANLAKQVAITDPSDKNSIPAGKWTDLDFKVHGHDYSATWVPGDTLTQNPFQLVHDRLVAEGGGGSKGEEYATDHMGQQSITVVGETRTNADGTKSNGFVILNGHVKQDHTKETPADMSNNTTTYDGGFGEEWLKGHYDFSNV